MVIITEETSISFSGGATNETVSITYPALESKISFINLSKNLNLKSLTISESSLQNFDVSDYLNLGNITYLSLRVNPISSVDLSKFTNLTQLNLYKTNLLNLDVSMLDKLSNLTAFSKLGPICIKVNQSQLENIPSGWAQFGTNTNYSINCETYRWKSNLLRH